MLRAHHRFLGVTPRIITNQQNSSFINSVSSSSPSSSIILPSSLSITSRNYSNSIFVTRTNNKSPSSLSTSVPLPHDFSLLLSSMPFLSYSHRQCSSHMNQPQQQQQLSNHFIKTLHCILYKLSTTTSSLSPKEKNAPVRASATRPRWVPLGVISAKLPVHLVDEELDKCEGGLRAVLQNNETLKEVCELEKDGLTGVWQARVHPIVVYQPGTQVPFHGSSIDRLAKLASIVSNQLLKIAKEEEMELDDDQDELNGKEKVFMTVSSLENFLDGHLHKTLIDEYQHLNIALVEAEKWIPEAQLCWSLELRNVEKNTSNWQQSVLALKRDDPFDLAECNNDEVAAANKSLSILRSMKEAIREVDRSSEEDQLSGGAHSRSSLGSPKSGGKKGGNYLSKDDMQGSIGGVPLPPPPLQGGGHGQHFVDPTSLEYDPNNPMSPKPSYLQELFDGNNINSSNSNLTPDTSIDIDLSLIPPAPSPEQMHQEYQKMSYEATVSKGQVYIPPNLSTSQELNGVALTVEDLMNFIPSFFIPVELALEQLEPLGYSREHIDNYVSSMKSVQMINATWPLAPTPATKHQFESNNGSGHTLKIQQQQEEAENSSSSSNNENPHNSNNNNNNNNNKIRQYIRIYAGGGKFDMSPILATNKRFAKYEPLPSLSRPFLKILTKPGQWMTIRDLLDVVGKEAEESLPFQGIDALLYFAQLQQIFVFSIERGGIVARRPASQNFSLFSSTTPCPVFYNQLCRGIERSLGGTRSRLHVDAVPQLIGNSTILEEMQRCFPNWQAFALAHNEKFMFDATTNEIMFRGAYEAEKRQQLGLEEQLEIAWQSRNMSAVKSLKRRIATMKNPDNPLLDPERLAAAIADFLPPSHHIKTSSLLKSLPDEMRDLLPKAGLLRFLKRFPVYFTCFDFKQAGVRHVQRAGLSLPSGALRSDFSKEEIVALCVQELQRNGRGRARVENLLLKMPGSVVEGLKRGAALAGILKEYSDCFVFVSSAGAVDVILVKPPSFVASQSGVVADNERNKNSNYQQQTENEDFGSDDEWVAMAKEAFPHQK